MVVVFVIIHPDRSPGTSFLEPLGAPGELESQEVRGREIGEGHFPCGLGPFCFIAKAGPLTPGCLFSGQLYTGVGKSATLRPRCCCPFWAFPLGNISLIYSIVLPGKAVICVYAEIGWASQNHGRVASCLLNLPEIPFTVTAFVLTLISPNCLLLLLESRLLQSTCQGFCVYL